MSLPATKIAVEEVCAAPGLSHVATRPNLALLPGGKRNLSPEVSPETSLNPRKAAIEPGVILLALTLSILQIGDLSLTLIGISHFGPEAEGNPLLRWLMSAMGETSALVLTKILAIAIIVFLASLAKRVAWIPSAMKALVVVYVLGAIIPWSTILILHLV
jgi:hypothetical protein